MSTALVKLDLETTPVVLIRRWMFPVSRELF
jgi:hypothetical protein